MAEKQVTKSEQDTERAPAFRAFDPFSTLRGEVDRLFDDFSRGFGREGRALFRGGRQAPSVDVVESDAELQVKADMPGMDEKDIEVSLSDGMLTIKGERRSEQEEKDDKEKSFHRVERSYGLYQRSIALPCDVDEDKTKAEFTKGVLTITLPKTEKAKAKVRKIAVKGS